MHDKPEREYIVEQVVTIRYQWRVTATTAREAAAYAADLGQYNATETFYERESNYKVRKVQ